MSDYTQITNFTAKDGLATGDPEKIILGSDVDAELAAIAIAIATKFEAVDIASDAQAAALTSDTVLLTPAKLAYALTNNTTAVYRSASGTAGSPAYATASEPDTGIYLAGANLLGISAGGVGNARFGATFTAFSFPVQVQDGSAGSPSSTFEADTNTGTYRIGTDTWAVSAGGTAGFAVDTNSVYLRNGAVSTPAMTFFDDPNTGFYRSGSGDVRFSADGAATVIMRAAASGSLLHTDTAGTFYDTGFKEVPQNSQTGNYTLVLSDSGKHIFHTSGAGAGDTYTIPANSSVGYNLGTVLTFINNDPSPVTIAITTDTLIWAGTTTTGSRSLAQNGIASAIKIGSTTWLISGTGLS
jgi:hypothetical protein